MWLIDDMIVSSIGDFINSSPPFFS